MRKIWRPEFERADLKILSEKNVYEGYARIKQYEVSFRSFQGGFGQPVVRDILSRREKNAVAVLLFDPKENKVILIEQCRLGTLQEEGSPWLLEIVAGVIDENETAISTAHKEVKEETDFDLIELIPICQYYASPGISAELTYVFCGMIDSKEFAKELSAEKNEKVCGLKEEGEDIKCHLFTKDEALTLLKEGKILSASAVIALQWLGGF